MGIIKYAEKIKEYILKDYSNLQVYVDNFSRNNNVNLVGIIIKDVNVKNISPVIYVNNFYDEKIQAFDAYKKVMEIYKNNSNISNIISNDILENIYDFDLVKNKITYILLSKSKNEKMLKNLCHMHINENVDLVIAFKIIFKDQENNILSTYITNNLLNEWKKDLDCIYNFAKINTPILLPINIFNLSDVIDDIDEYIPIFASTNKNMTYGASSILYEEFDKYLIENGMESVILIPSSIHEMIFIPYNTIYKNLDDLNKIINEVNFNMLNPEDVLDDKAYIYSISKGIQTF